MEFLEGDDADAIGGGADTGRPEFVLDFLGEVRRECHGVSVVVCRNRSVPWRAFGVLSGS
jgi:hypothetical protein